MQGGAEALKGYKRGPKTNYRRTEEVVRQVIRYRFLDPNMSPEVISQMLIQCGHQIGIISASGNLHDETEDWRPGKRLECRTFGK